MLKKLIATLALTFATQASAQCQGDNYLAGISPADMAEIERNVAASPFPVGNLWSATKPGSSVTIVGTVHIFHPKIAGLVNAALPLVQNADRVFFEALEEDEAELKRKILEDPEIGFIVEGPTLPQLLEPEEWAQLSSEMKARGVPGFLAAKMKPWQIGITLGIPVCALAQVADGNGVDRQLRDAATQADTPMQALDNMDDLLAILTGGTFEEQLEDLRFGLKLINDARPMFNTMIETFISGDHRLGWELSKYQAFTNAGDDLERIQNAFNELEAKLLIERNQKWMDILIPAVSDGTYVVAVGAAHLSGEQGLLNLFQENGYTLTRIEIAQ